MCEFIYKKLACERVDNDNHKRKRVKQTLMIDVLTICRLLLEDLLVDLEYDTSYIPQMSMVMSPRQALNDLCQSTHAW